MAEHSENIMPKHVAIIMDGNGRWAKERSKPRVFGHKAGAQRVRDVVEASSELGIKALTLYAFSEENWGRPEAEVSALFQLLMSYLKSEVAKLKKENVRLSAIGKLERLPLECQKLIAQAQESTEHNDGLVLTLALSYGSRTEIVDCCRKVAQRVAAKELEVADIDQALVSQHLYTAGSADPDLVIRTSGEQRISNFLLWQIAYAELFFSPVYWPDFTKERYLEAIHAFQQRQRRFGKIDELPQGFVIPGFHSISSN